MSNFNELKEYYKDKPASQKLAALRNEVSTPLAVIRGYSQLLKDIELTTTSISVNEIKKWIEKIDRASEDITQIIEALTSDNKI